MVKKSIIISSILFFIYNLCLFAVDITVKPGHQWQSNIIKAEEYIYNNNEKKSVIVGSSLSCVLVEDLLPESSCNIAFAGQSALDGLEIIKRTESKPDTVLIETNAIFRSTDWSFLNSLFMPVRSSLKKIFPALKEKNQPVCLLNSIIFWSLSNLRKIITSDNKKINIENSSVKLNDKKTTQKVNKKTKDLMLNILIKNYDNSPDNKIIEKRKNDLIKYKKYLENDGIKIVLFEMPIDKRLMNSKMIECTRRLIRDVFPPEKYIFLESPDCSQFTTTDGIHLDHTSASLYTSYLSGKMNRHKQKDENSHN